MNKRTNNHLQIHPIYHGTDIHAYTQQLKTMSDHYSPDIINKYGNVISEEEWNHLLSELQKHYGKKVALMNMNSQFKNGWISDPQVPSLNSAILLKALWEKIKRNDVSMIKHFEETLDQIGSTCIQGISHRLFIDYIALLNDEQCIIEAVIKSEIRSLLNELILQVENK